MNKYLREQIKLKKIEEEARMLIDEISDTKIMLDNNNITKTQRGKAFLKMEDLMFKKDGLIKKLKTQKNVIEEIEERHNKKKIIPKFDFINCRPIM